MTRMKVKNIYCVFLFFSTFVTTIQQKLVENCGVQLDSITKAISQTSSNFAPWVVSVGSGEGIEQEYLALCTGTILSGFFFLYLEFLKAFDILIFLLESVILTAAHCVSDRRYVRIVVVKSNQISD